MDCHTGGGTYVNGMRVRDQQLEPGDQIHIGETIFAYREAGGAPDLDSPHHTLLRACSLLFLFRALATTKNEPQRAILEEQIVALIGDLVPSTGGAVVLGGRSAQSGREDALELPLYVRGAVAGTLAAWFPPDESRQSLGSSRDPQRDRHPGRGGARKRPRSGAPAERERATEGTARHD